eukprot:6197643-Pleurochrysis_carterae.AAC.1
MLFGKASASSAAQGEDRLGWTFGAYHGRQNMQTLCGARLRNASGLSRGSLLATIWLIGKPLRAEEHHMRELGEGDATVAVCVCRNHHFVNRRVGAARVKLLHDRAEL